MAPGYSDRPGVADRVTDTEYSTDPGRYRHTGAIPRQRVAFVGDAPETAQPGSGPDIYQADWEPRKRRRGRRRARGSGRTVTMLVAVGVVGAAVGGVVAFGPGQLPGTTPVAVDAALDQRSSLPPAAGRGGVRQVPSPSPSVAAKKTPAASTKSAKATKSPTPGPPEPVSGLTRRR